MKQFDSVIGIIVVLVVVVVVAVVFYPNVGELYEDVKKIAEEVLELKPTEGEVEEELKIKQVFNKIVENMKKCVESEKEDCVCDFDDGSFSGDYLLGFKNDEGISVELYSIKSGETGVLVKKEKIETDVKFALSDDYVDGKIECKIVDGHSLNPVLSLLSYTEYDESFPGFYKGENEICILSISLGHSNGFPPGLLGPSYKKFKEKFKKESCI